MATDAPARPPARPAGLGHLPPPALIALAAGVAAAGALAVWQPLVGLGLAVLAALVALIARIPMPRLGAALVVLTAVAAIAGPNLAAPSAPWLFGFRILIVVLGLGLIAYLLMDGRLVLPAGVPRPAGLLGIWVLWSALSLAWAADTVAALRWTLFLTMMGGLAIGIALLCREPRRARILLWALGGAFVAACLVALVEIATGLHLPTSRGVQRQGLFGATSFFGNENNFATYLTLTLPYLAVIPLFVRDVRLKAAGYTGSILALLMILTTGSKSALISVGLILIALLVIVGRDRESRGRLAAAAAIAGLTVALLVPATLGSGPLALSQRAVTKLDFGLLLEQIESQTGSGGVRASLLTEGLALVDDSNGLGVGAGNAETSVKSLKDFPGAANLHNWWLEVLVNGGLVGFALYLAFFLGLLRGQARAVRGSPDPFVRYMALAGTLAMIGFVAGSLGPSTAIHFAPMWITFGLGMGAIVLARRAAREAAGERRMRVLMLSHMYPSAVNPTAGIFVDEQVRALRALGHDVRVVSPTGWAPPLVPRYRNNRLVPGVDDHDGVPVLYPRKLTLPGARLGHRNAHAMRAALARPLRRVYARWPFEVIHAHMLVPDGWAAAKVAEDLCVPVLATTHRADVLDVPARGGRSRDQVAEAVASIDQITAVSAAIAAAAERLASPRRPVEVVPNGADTTVFMPRDRSEARLRLGLRDDGPLVTFVGKLVPRKGVDALIEAMGLLAARPAGAPRLAMVGIGELRPGLEARARELGIADRIHWAGKVPHDEVAWWMAAGDVFVLPSLSEGLPTVICEVMSCARPAVATAVDGTPEIVRDGETGLLVPPRDPGSLALALGRLVDDPALARRMGDRALEIGRETYTWHANAVRTAELYRRITA